MPRGPVAGATAALIDALAALGIRVSRYQIERWRAAGDLPRPVRHGLGRGRGVTSDEPDQATVRIAAVLARSARRGSRRPGTHLLERFAAGRPVAESDVRRVFATAVERATRLVGGDVSDTDAAWQNRQNRAVAVARHDITPFGWQDLAAAAQGRDAPLPAKRPRDVRRSVAAGLLHALAGGEGSDPDGLLALIGIWADLSPAEHDNMRRLQHARELAGLPDPVNELTAVFALTSLLHVAEQTGLQDLRRAVAAVLQVHILQSLVTMLGTLPAEARSGLPAPIDRFDASMLRKVQADPMWPIANRLVLRPRNHIDTLAVAALLIVRAGLLDSWEAYHDRLVHITTPMPLTV